MTSKSPEILKILIEILSELKSIGVKNKLWMTVDELSSYIGLSKSTIYQYAHRNKIPFSKIPHSRKLIFSRRDIDSWIRGDDSSQQRDWAIRQSNRIWEQVRDRNL